MINPPIATREAFGHALCELGEQHKNIIVLDGDVQNSTFTELFHKKFPDRFIQCFVAEQNMVGVATGLALQGFIPFATTFGAFFTRAHDQIRMAAISHAPVRLVGSHVGVSIGADGPSQMALEDIALMRSVPHSLVLSPADALSAQKLTACLVNYHEGISYLRTMRGATPLLYTPDTPFYPGGCIVVREPSNPDLCIVGTGITVHEALAAHNQLQSKGISATIIDCYSLKPLPETALRTAIHKAHGRCIVVEDHYAAGGLGEAVAQALSQDPFKIVSLAITKIPRSGTPEELRAFEGIDAHAIVQTARKLTNL